MDPVLSYDFAEIEFSVRQEIHTTATRLNAALEDLRSRIEPLQTMWTRESAAAYRLEQDRDPADARGQGGRQDRPRPADAAGQCGT